MPTNGNAYAQGIDVSQWQGNKFPFDRATTAGFSFAYLRASVRAHTDPCYHVNHTRAIDAGMLTGSYHYLYPSPDPHDQARAFYLTIADQAPEFAVDQLPPALDVEDLQLTEKHVLEFISAWSRLTNAPLAIYTSRRAWHSIVGGGAEWAASLPLWVADWRGKDQPALPQPWEHWLFWQWTSKGRVPGHQGRVPGHQGHVDLNYYNGTFNHLQRHYPELWR